MNDSKTFSTVKAASPHTLFARFLHKKTAEPTVKQLNNWDYDGGQGYSDDEEYLAIVNGRICRSPFQKIMAHLSRIWSGSSHPTQARTRHNE
jgi:hypothetical protein